MTSRLTSDDAEALSGGASPAPSHDSDAKAPSDAPQAGAPQPETPHVASPPTSPWWTAPAGKSVDIPAFGRSLIEILVAILFPAPHPVPVRIRR